MNDPLPPNHRRYSDREIAKILKRASQMQRESPARPDPTGLTLAELEEIAIEAGIDPENLRLAAAEHASPSEESLETRLLGAPLTQRLERVLPGELPVDSMGSLIPLIQAEAGVAGQASTVGNALTWSASAQSNSASSLNILVIAENGETMIQLEERSSQAAIGFHVGFGSAGLGFAIPAGVSVGAMVGVAAGLGVGVAVGGLFYLLGRSLYKFTTERRRKRAEVTFQRLVERVAALIARRGIEGGGDPSPALLPG